MRDGVLTAFREWCKMQPSTIAVSSMTQAGSRPVNLLLVDAGKVIGIQEAAAKLEEFISEAAKQEEGDNT